MEDGNGGGSTPAAKVDRFLLLPMTGRFVQQNLYLFFQINSPPEKCHFAKDR